MFRMFSPGVNVLCVGDCADAFLRRVLWLRRMRQILSGTTIKRVAESLNNQSDAHEGDAINYVS